MSLYWNSGGAFQFEPLMMRSGSAWDTKLRYLLGCLLGGISQITARISVLNFNSRLVIPFILTQAQRQTRKA